MVVKVRLGNWLYSTFKREFCVVLNIWLGGRYRGAYRRHAELDDVLGNGYSMAGSVSGGIVVVAVDRLDKAGGEQ